MIIENGLKKYYTASLGILQKLIYYKISITAAIVNTTAFYFFKYDKGWKNGPQGIAKEIGFLHPMMWKILNWVNIECT